MLTVLVTTCRTLTRPGCPLASVSTLRSYEALHGAALSGVGTKGDVAEWAECAEPGTGENGDCGMRRRGVRADLGAGFANGDGGMVTRGDSGLVLPVLAAPDAPAVNVVLRSLDAVVVVLTEDAESRDELRDNGG